MKYKLFFTASHDERLLAIRLSKNFFLTGGTGKILYKYDYKNFESLVTHTKAIRTITINLPYFACASYDCTTTVFKNEKVLDIIEGPETEIKSVSFSKQFDILLATRGKSVWLLKNVDDEYEIERILEDHTQDVKGAKFCGDFILTFGYDRTIKVYENELIQSIEHDCTVWDILYNNEFLVSVDNTGFVYFYKYDELFYLEKKIKISNYPIYSICKIKDYIGLVVNRNDIYIIDYLGNIIMNIEDGHKGEINCIDFCEENNLLASVGDDGKINIYEIEF